MDLMLKACELAGYTVGCGLIALVCLGVYKLIKMVGFKLLAH